MRTIKLLVSFLIVMSCSIPVRAEPLKEFLTSTTYGVLAGTIVGAASLAFTSQPGDNLRNIAKGASIGLYAGILLGIYVVYIVPSQGAVDSTLPLEEQEALPPIDEVQPLQPQGESGIDPQSLNFKPLVVPIFSKNGIDGMGVQMQITSF